MMIKYYKVGRTKKINNYCNDNVCLISPVYPYIFNNNCGFITINVAVPKRTPNCYGKTKNKTIIRKTIQHKEQKRKKTNLNHVDYARTGALKECMQHPS